MSKKFLPSPNTPNPLEPSGFNVGDGAPLATSGFVKRTVLATAIILGLIGLTLAIYVSPARAAIYLLAGLWSLVFFALTAATYNMLLFERRRLLGICLIGIKLGWLGVLYIAGSRWAATSNTTMAETMALIAGLTTPLATTALRTAGAMVPSPPVSSRSGSHRAPKGEATP
jgi:hypothetical protein